MKINKNVLYENKAKQKDSKKVSKILAEDTADTDIAIDDVEATPVDELADAIQDAAEEASDGAEAYSDEKATKIAQELKTIAKGFDAAAWAPLDVPNELTDKLDDCLSNAMVGNHMKATDGVDLLVTGLPGSGKTGITKKWAKDRGVNLFYLNAKDDDLGANLNGFPVSTVEKDEDGNEKHVVTRAFSNALKALDEPNSVLFLDEFNRAAPKLRAVLLTLINEHAIAGEGKDGFKYFDNLLFTVACINPAVPTDPGAMELNDAEKSRFVDEIDWDSQPGNALRYVLFHIKTLMDQLKPEDENYNFLYTRYAKIKNLANALIGDPRFEFDNRDDLFDLFNEKAKMLNQRSITDALMSHGYNKAKFLNWVDKYSKFLEKDIVMIHSILDSWVEPTVIVGDNSADQGQATSTSTSNSSNDSDDLDGEFADVFGEDGDESDEDLFGSSASAAATSAKVNASDALNRIKGFDFSKI